MPEGSETIINDPSSVQPNLTVDLPGNYVVSLTVNDGFVSSDPFNITIVVISYPDAVTESLQSEITIINDLDIEVLKNKNMQNALTNKIGAALTMIDQGLYQEALDKLQNDILDKTNGCAEIGAPDNNDWIDDCESQGKVYPMILETIELLMNLI